MALLTTAFVQSLAHTDYLNSASTFAVLGSSTVTNTGDTIVRGDLGVWPGTAVTGFFAPGIVVGGTIQSASVASQSAHTDTIAAFTNFANMAYTQDLTGQNLGGMTLTPGVYFFASSAFLDTNVLTLDAQGDPNALFVFQMGSTIVTASASSVVGINGANSCNVFWKVGSSATLGTTTSFMGTILAQASITMTNGATLQGRALAIDGAVTMDSNAIDVCVGSPPPPPPCFGDIAAPGPDGFIDGADLATLLGSWGPVTGLDPADSNADGLVDGIDLTLLLSGWGICH